MDEPMPDAVLDELMARAGLPPDPATRASLREASAALAALVARLHRPLPVEAEPAPVFAPLDPRV